MDVYFEAFRDRDNRILVSKLRNKAFSAHFHSNIEVMYVKKGMMEVVVGGEKRIMCANSVVVAESYAVHSLFGNTESEIMVAIIPVIQVPDFSRAQRNRTFSTPFLESSPESTAIGALIQNFYEAMPGSNGMISKGYAYLLLGMLTDALGTVPAAARSKDGIAVVGQMLRYMDEHYTEPITLEKIAVELGYHKDYLSRVFNETIQTGFCRYLATMRLRYAVQLIRTTDLSIEEVSDSAGFGNTHSFYDIFRETYHCTPGEFRKRMGKRMTAPRSTRTVDHLSS